MAITKIKNTSKTVCNNDNNFLVLADNINNGNFDSFEKTIAFIKNSMEFLPTIGWWRYLTKKVIVTGTFNLNPVEDLDFNETVTFDGDSCIISLDSSGFTGTCNNVIFKNITFIASGSGQFNIGNNVQFINCFFISQYEKLLLLNGSDIIITDCTFTHGYSSLNKNYNSGLISCIVSTSSEIDNITIKNNKFNYNGTITGSLATRVPCIYFELQSLSSIINNLNISNNKFINNSISVNTQYDYTAVISIVSTYNSTGTTYSLLNNCKISDNYCNDNQMLLMTSKTFGSPSTIRNIFAIKNTIVENNTFGAIGFYTGESASHSIVGFPVNNNYFDNKYSGLSIINNTVGIIASMDQDGQYHSPYDLGVSVASGAMYMGNVNIINNNCSFIHLNAGKNITIKNNKIRQTYDSTGTVLSSTYNDSNIDTGIRIVCERAVDTAYSLYESIICENILDGYQSSQKFNSAIVCYSDCIVSKNIIKNNLFTTGLSTSCIAIVVGGLSNIVTENKIYRNNTTIAAYVQAYHPSNMTGSKGKVVENYFDSIYRDIDGIDKNLDAGSIPGSWQYEKNINQTKYSEIPLFDLIDGSVVGLEGAGPYIYISPGASTALGNIDKLIDITNFIQKGTKVKRATIGVFSELATTMDFGAPTNNRFIFTFITSIPKLENSTNLIDIKNNLGASSEGAGTVTYSVTDSTELALLKGGTQYIDLDLNNGIYYENKSIYITLDINYKQQTSSTYTVYLSTIQIEYTW